MVELPAPYYEQVMNRPGQLGFGKTVAPLQPTNGLERFPIALAERALRNAAVRIAQRERHPGFLRTLRGNDPWQRILRRMARCCQVDELLILPGHGTALGLAVQARSGHA